jgi:rare lipoprotein A
MTRAAVCLASVLWLGCAPAPAPAPPPIDADRAAADEGLASYYAKSFHGRRTASGVVLDNDAMVAAHPTYPFGTVLRVTNLANGKTVDVRIVDRGPAPRARRRGVIIDLSRAAAAKLDFMEEGHARVRIERRRV